MSKIKSYLLMLALGLIHWAEAQTISFSGLDDRLDSVKKVVLSDIKYQVGYEYAYRTNPQDTLKTYKEPMLLQVGDSHLRFLSAYLYARDTIQDNAYRQGVKSFLEIMPSLQRTYKLARFTEQYLIDLNTRTLRGNVPVVIDNWVYTEDLPTQMWELIEGDSTILGYACKPATTTFRGRKYTAYYAPELALPYGPWKFSGLPGLILALSDEKGEHKYTAIGIEEIKEYRPLYQPVLSREKKGKRKEILRILSNAAKNPAMILGNLEGVKIDEKTLAGIKPRPHNPQELE